MTMQTITRRCAIAIAAALLLAAVPGVARAQTVPALGHAAVAGTLTFADAPGCTPATFHEAATAVGVIEDPVGTYAGTLTVAADGTSLCFNSLLIDTGSFTVSVTGNDGGHSIVCRDAASPANAPAPMPGIWQQIGGYYVLAADGICNIDGHDSVHEQVWQTLVGTPGSGVVAGDLRISNLV
jgi:hypothetical protein